MSVVFVATMSQVQDDVLGDGRNSIMICGGGNQGENPGLFLVAEMFEITNQLLNAFWNLAFFIT